ncbi:MAG: porin family protein [Steroidobacteraceae bacterium]
MQRIALATLSLLAGAAPALVNAADNGFYLGAGITQSKLDGTLDQFDFKDTSYKIIAGMRLLDSFGVEASYMDLGSDAVNFGSFGLSADARAVAAFAVAYLPLPIVDLYAKGGLARWETKLATSGVTVTNLDDNGTDFAWGLGGQLHFGSLAARLEYESFDVKNTNGADLVSVSLLYTFL